MNDINIKEKNRFNRDYYIFGDVNPLSRNKLARNLDKYIDISGVKELLPTVFDIVMLFYLSIIKWMTLLLPKD